MKFVYDYASMHHSITVEAARKARMSSPTAGGSPGSQGTIGGTAQKIIERFVADNTGSPTPPATKTRAYNPKVDGDAGAQKTKTGDSDKFGPLAGSYGGV